jgi:hypothetical protein
MSGLSPLVVSALFALGVGLVLRRFSREVRQVVVLSAVAHVVSVLAQVWLTTSYYRGGDMLNYFRAGQVLARLLDADFSRYGGEVAALFFQRPADFPVYVFGLGSSTGTVSATAGCLVYALGPSLHAAAISVAAFSFFGKVALLDALQGRLRPDLRLPAALACLLLPSAVFWSSALLKEPMAVGGLGFALWGLHALARDGGVRPFFVLVPGLVVVGLVKSYILFALVPAILVFRYWTITLRSTGRPVTIQPARLGAAAVLGVALIAVLGALFPRYATEALTDEVSRLQVIGAQVGGGSYYQVAEPLPERSLLGQLLYAPLALATAVFRPLLVEARNAPMLVAALEMTVLALLTFRAALGRSWAWIGWTLRTSPTLAASATFVLLMGTAVGLASTNLGTLSRYRVPMLPFLALMVLVWSAPTGRREGAR